MKIKRGVNKSAVAKKGKLPVSVSTSTKPRGSRASGVLSSVHETMSGLHAAGVVKTETMREFDKLCLEGRRML
jgi:hypothetical protein